MHKYRSKRIQTANKINRTLLHKLPEQNLHFDAAQESVRCYHNEPKIKIFKQCLQGRS